MSLAGYLRHIHELNQWEPDHFRAFYVAGRRVGHLKEAMWQALGQWPERFRVTPGRVEFRDPIGTFEGRSQALDRVCQALLEQGVISHLHGERYPVTAEGRDEALATIDRAAAPYFGLRAYGQHLNGYVRGEKGLMLWIARRAADRVNFPGRLDNMVAGGLPQALGLRENLLKECREEAAVPAGLASRAIPTGALSYRKETQVGLKPDTIYCYDLELPVDFVPRNTDGEVAEFYLMGVREVARIVRESDEFKLNCNLVIIDFLIRHGIIDPQQRGYLQLVEGLHERL